MKNCFKLVFALSLLFSGRLGADEELDAKAAFKRGADLMAEQHFTEAIPYLKKAETAFPTAPSVLWNLGIASAAVANHAEALGYWQKYQKSKSDDWNVIPKLVQTYEAMGDSKARDLELRALYDLRATALNSDLGKAEKFCREQFAVDGKTIFAFEYFSPQSPNRVFYRFSTVDPSSGDETSFISLESSDTTTAIARELGEISKTARAYHIDRYVRKEHQTYAHLNEKPSYETVRKLVVDILQGKLRAVSASSRGEAGQRKR